MEERLKSHYESLSRSIGFTGSADAKAAPVVALQIAFMGTLAARLEKLIPALTADVWSVEKALLWVLLIVYIVFVLTAVTAAVWVFIPVNPRTGASLIYFEEIAAMQYDSFVKRAKGMSSNMIEEQLLSQVYRVSQVASAKMRRVHYALWLSAPSFLLWVILLVWGEIVSPSCSAV